MPGAPFIDGGWSRRRSRRFSSMPAPPTRSRAPPGIRNYLAIKNVAIRP